MAKRQALRRGALLLVVLSLLMLMTIIAITFVLVSSQFKRGAEAFTRHDTVGDLPQKDLDRAMYQLVRGTLNRRSVLLGHSLLGDLYGSDSVKLPAVQGITAIEPIAGGQFRPIRRSCDSAFS